MGFQIVFAKWMCVHMCILVHMHISVHMYVDICVNVCLCMYLHICMWMSMYLYAQWLKSHDIINILLFPVLCIIIRHHCMNLFYDGIVLSLHLLILSLITSHNFEQNEDMTDVVEDRNLWRGIFWRKPPSLPSSIQRIHDSPSKVASYSPPTRRDLESPRRHRMCLWEYFPEKWNWRGNIMSVGSAAWQNGTQMSKQMVK